MSDKKQQDQSAVATAAAAASPDEDLVIVLEDDAVAKKGHIAAPAKVIVHPLVLLSAVDHFNRVAEDSNKRVCGILLGTSQGGVVDVTNSYAVPFEEDAKHAQTWLFDHDYALAMFALYKKVNATERIVGWYSSGPRVRHNDLAIHEIVRRTVDNPVFVVIDVAVKEGTNEAPAKAYVSVPAAPDAADPKATHAFVHVPVETGADEAEAIGVEHLLREIKDAAFSSSSVHDVVQQRLASLRALRGRIDEVHSYVDRVCAGELPASAKVLAQIQEAFNACPDLAQPGLAESIADATHDSLMVVYVASLVRGVTGVHDLVQNKQLNRAAEHSERTRAAMLAASKAKEEDADGGAGDVDMETVGEDF